MFGTKTTSALSRPPSKSGMGSWASRGSSPRGMVTPPRPVRSAGVKPTALAKSQVFSAPKPATIPQGVPAPYRPKTSAALAFVVGALRAKTSSVGQAMAKGVWQGITAPLRAIPKRYSIGIPALVGGGWAATKGYQGLSRANQNYATNNASARTRQGLQQSYWQGSGRQR